MDIGELLADIVERLERIEQLLSHKQSTKNGTQINYESDSETEYPTHSSLPDDELIDPSVDSSVSYISDDDNDPIIMEESYGSDNDFPIERPEVFPEPKLLLTPLQIQLANEEFMQYKGQSESDNSFEYI